MYNQGVRNTFVKRSKEVCTVVVSSVATIGLVGSALNALVVRAWIPAMYFALSGKFWMQQGLVLSSWQFMYRISRIALRCTLSV